MVSATEYRNRKSVLRKDPVQLGEAQMHRNHAAIVFDTTVGGSRSFAFRSEMPFLSDKTRFKTKRSTLAVKGPAHTWFSHQAAQPYRPLVRQARPHLSYDQKNEFSVTYVLEVWIMFL